MNRQRAMTDVIEPMRPGTVLDECAIHASGDWFVVHTKPRQEKALSRDLDALGVSHFLPLTRVVRYYGRRKALAELPLFPGYVFLRGEVDEAYEADRTRRVAGIIRVPNQTELQDQLASIADALAMDAPLDPHPYLKKGTPVEVRCGPFKGLRGVVEDKKQNRLVLQVNVLGQASSMEIDGSLLDPIDALDEALVAGA